MTLMEGHPVQGISCQEDSVLGKRFCLLDGKYNIMSIYALSVDSLSLLI